MMKLKKNVEHAFIQVSFSGAAVPYNDIRH